MKNNGHRAARFSWSPDSPRRGERDVGGREPPASEEEEFDLPPHSLEAEKGVLGCILIDSKLSLPTVLELQIEDFYDLRHQKIFATLAELLVAQKPLDIISLHQRLCDDGHLHSVGGLGYLNQIIDSVPSPSNLPYYVEILTEKGAARRLLRVCIETAHKAQSGNRPADLIHILERQIAAIRQQSIGSGSASFAEATISASDLETVNLPGRRAILGSFFCNGDVGFLFGRRGIGKTLVALKLCALAVEGGTLNQWRSVGGARVLYVDCEMPFAEMAARIRGFGLGDRNDFFLLSHEVLFARTNRSLNLADPSQQRAILETLKHNRCNLLVFDNLSTGLRGVKENDASDWDPVGAWLLDMRRQGIASLILHHAGRNNEMRGTSRREDPATWVLRLDENHDRGDASQAQVVVRFTKYRSGSREDAEPFALRFRQDGQEIRAETDRIDTIDLLVEWVEAGLTSASDIAAEMGMSKGQISKLASRAIAVGRLVKRGREYARS